MEMVGLRSAFGLLVLMIFVTWVEGENGQDCSSKGGECINNIPPSYCPNTLLNQDCSTFQICCKKPPPMCKVDGICQSECNNQRIQVGDCPDGKKCCNCKPTCECLGSYGFSMTTSSNIKCDGKVNDSWSEGTNCTCCIPACPATPDCLSAGGRCALSCGNGEDSHPSIECIKGNSAACLCCVPKKKCEKNFWCTIFGGQCRGKCDQKSLVVDRTFKCKNGCVCCKPHHLWL